MAIPSIMHIIGVVSLMTFLFLGTTAISNQRLLETAESPLRDWEAMCFRQ